jgi:hypothetical protein
VPTVLVVDGIRGQSTDPPESLSESVCHTERQGSARSDANITSGRRYTTVLGLRFFVCRGCGTVYADVEERLRCPRCEDEPLEELGTGTQAAAYFAGR